MSHCPAQLPHTGVTEATSHGTKCRPFVSFGTETIILLYKCPGLRVLSTPCPAVGLLVIFIPIWCWWDQNQPRTMVSVGGAGDCDNRMCPLFLGVLAAARGLSRSQVVTLGTMHHNAGMSPLCAWSMVLPAAVFCQPMIDIRCQVSSTEYQGH